MKGFSKIVSLSVLALSVLVPVFVYALTDQSTASPPPIGQPLVREGTLATRLAEVLMVGNPANEAEAESALASVGIAPKNGWIADYPVTPDIAVELQNSISDAAAGGRLSMGQEAALKAYGDILAGYNLTVKADTQTQSMQATAAPTYPDPTTIYNYYYDEGPPIVTYYAPPYDYAYLYSWVPYPFWWWGFWYPGFFVLADFHFNYHQGHGHHGWDGNHEFVSNHFRDPVTGRTSRIDPVNRTFGGTVTGNTASRWSAPSAQRGAAAIFNNSRGVTPSQSIAPRPAFDSREGGRPAFNSYQGGRPTRNFERGNISATPVGRTSGLPQSSSYVGSRRMSTPSAGSRAFTTPPVSRSLSAPSGSPRAYNAPSVSRSQGGPSGGSRMYSAPSVSRGFSAGAPRASISGGSFFGGMRR